MTDLLQFLLKYGYIVTFAAAFLEQIGIPLPAATLLIGMGALARSGHFVLPVVIATAALAALAADLIWYELGRAHGSIGSFDCSAGSPSNPTIAYGALKTPLNGSACGRCCPPSLFPDSMRPPCRWPG